MTLAFETDEMRPAAAVAPDAPTLREVITRFEAPLIRHAQRILKDPERARDVVQDTFLKLHEADVALDDPRLERWLFTVCRNRAIDVWRKESRLTLTERPDDVPAPASEEEHRAVSEVFERIAEMPEPRVRVLELRFREGRSYKQIAAATGMTVSHVGVLIHKSVAALRSQLAVVASLALVIAAGGAYLALEREAAVPLGTRVAPALRGGDVEPARGAAPAPAPAPAPAAGEASVAVPIARPAAKPSPGPRAQAFGVVEEPAQRAQRPAEEPQASAEPPRAAPPPPRPPKRGSTRPPGSDVGF